MEDKIKNSYFQVKTELERVKKELKSRNKAFRALENKYKKLLMLKDLNQVPFYINKNNTVEVPLIKKKTLKIFSIRSLLAVVLLAFMISYSVQFSLSKDNQNYAYITKGLVFPKRCVAAVGNFFSNK